MISIIVPIYKAERYMRHCLDSLRNQSYSNWECILVDDGSPDESGNICDEYALKDRRFKVVHKENRGVSAARQTGIDVATGQYVIHADPDDWVEPDWLKNFADCIHRIHADIIFSDYYKDTIYNSKYVTQDLSGLSSYSIINRLINYKAWGTTWAYMVNIDFVRRNKICFLPNMSLWEDQYFTLCVLLANPKVAYIHKAGYHYNVFQNADSIVRAANLQQVESEKILVSKLGGILENRGFDITPLKYSVKARLYQTGKYKKNQIHDLYPEINKDVIKSFSLKELATEKCNIVLCIMGHEQCAELIKPLQAFIKKLNYKFDKLKRLLCRK